MKSQHRSVANMLVWGLIANLLLAGSIGQACTVMRFSFEDRVIVARNHDWSFGEGLLVVNRRGIQKRAISPSNPAEWVSKHGSVSFVQFGCEIPFAGMNEKGLTVDLLQLNQAEFPAFDASKSSVNVIQWVQYQLDTASSVSEVIASLDRVYPTPMIASLERVHYFVTDASGDVATIAFLGGKATVTRGNQHYHCALANSTVKDSLAAYRGGQAQSNSELRYCQAVEQIELASGDDAVADPMAHARASLAMVAQPDSTQWGIVYEPSERKLSFSTRVANRLRWIDLDDVAFETNAPALIVDVNADLSGDLVPHLREYTRGENERIVNFAFDQMMPAGFVRTAIKQLVLTYPSTLKPVTEMPVSVESR